MTSSGDTDLFLFVDSVPEDNKKITEMAMVRFSSRIIVIFALVSIVFIAPAPKAEAFDPGMASLLMSVALPIAIEVGKVVAPYVIDGVVNFTGGMIEVFTDMFGIFLIPIGMAESTVGAPFGLFDSGLKHMGDGCLAPLKMTWSTVKLPIKIFSG